ncbi:hypothetical protein PTTG_00862 [Puccinia triticina 1-1 BBBD Race 1]|uniref:Uncharacterized protein n=1 Tax=Puccinia triticina (isolate 1-1 / race 1 (BBBD)) TaxID=630390 RepID=A0A180GL81_PUCT1|nr:hypothetical protein PTTG_00862 [Puccinia triticina 1-1 BBBD Race 1]
MMDDDSEYEEDAHLSESELEREDELLGSWNELDQPRLLPPGGLETLPIEHTRQQSGKKRPTLNPSGREPQPAPPSPHTTSPPTPPPSRRSSHSDSLQSASDSRNNDAGTGGSLMSGSTRTTLVTSISTLSSVGEEYTDPDNNPSFSNPFQTDQQQQQHPSSFRDVPSLHTNPAFRSATTSGPSTWPSSSPSRSLSPPVHHLHPRSRLTLVAFTVGASSGGGGGARGQCQLLYTPFLTVGKPASLKRVEFAIEQLARAGRTEDILTAQNWKYFGKDIVVAQQAEDSANGETDYSFIQLSVGMSNARVSIGIAEKKWFKMKKISGLSHVISSDGQHADLELGQLRFGERRDMLVEVEMRSAREVYRTQSRRSYDGDQALMESTHAEKTGTDAFFRSQMGGEADLGGMMGKTDAFTRFYEAQVEEMNDHMILLEVTSEN